MKRKTDRLIYGYLKFKPTVGVSLEVFRDELTTQSRELSAPDFSSMVQVHGNRISQAKPGSIHSNTDGLIAEQRGLMLFGSFADCLPILLWDDKMDLIGLAHAGWKGTVGRIAERLAEALIERGARDLRAWIGPGICANHYQVGEDFFDQIQPFNPDAFIQLPDDQFFDLKLENKSQLSQYLDPSFIEVSEVCTYESPDFYSYRRDKTERGRNLAYLMLK